MWGWKRDKSKSFNVPLASHYCRVTAWHLAGSLAAPHWRQLAGICLYLCVIPQLPSERQEGRSGPVDRGVLTYPVAKRGQGSYQCLVSYCWFNAAEQKWGQWSELIPLKKNNDTGNPFSWQDVNFVQLCTTTHSFPFSLPVSYLYTHEGWL